MPLGPGKYDRSCSQVREETNAGAVILIVLGGDLGSGFSVQAFPSLLPGLPTLLRTVAAELEASCGQA